MKHGLLIAATLCGLLLCGSGCTPKRQANENRQDSVEISDITEYAYNCADSAILTMDIKRKAAQLFMPAIYASADPYTLQRLREYARMGVGGIVLLKGDSRSVAIIADSLAQWCEIPPFIAIDAEWGLAMRLADAPGFPINSKISDDADEDAMYEYGCEVARECRNIGVNMVLGPVLDVSEKDSFIGKRSLGNDPERVANLSVAYARGLESGNVVSVAKHFPGHGAAAGDSHRRKPKIERSLQSLDSIDLLPFRRYIEQRLSAVMIGHLAFPAIDSEMRPAAVSRTVITDLLRNDLGFDGLVLTDALNMLGAEGYGADDALEAGADIILAPTDTRREIDRVLAALQQERISETDLDNALRHILRKKYLLTLFYDSETQSAQNLPRALDTKEADRIRARLRYSSAKQ